MCDLERGKLGCTTFEGMFLWEESEATLKTILCDSGFFVKSPCDFWFSSSRLCASDLDSSSFQSSPLEELVRASAEGHFIGLDKSFFDCFLSSSVLDYLIILPLSYRLFAFFCILGEIFLGGLLALCILRSVKH